MILINKNVTTTYPFKFIPTLKNLLKEAWDLWFQ